MSPKCSCFFSKTSYKKYEKLRNCFGPCCIIDSLRDLFERMLWVISCQICVWHMSQKVVLQIHQGDTNISFNKSDNIFLSKTILILFVRCFGEKGTKHFGDISPRNLPHESFGLVGYFPKMSQTFLRTLSLCNPVGDISHQ